MDFRRIVVLRDIHSNLIEEAILVLRTEPVCENATGKSAEGNRAEEGKRTERGRDFILKEAQAIIDNYIESIRQTENRTNERKKKKSEVTRRFLTNLAINLALSGSILLLALVISRFV